MFYGTDAIRCEGRGQGVMIIIIIKGISFFRPFDFRRKRRFQKYRTNKRVHESKCFVGQNTLLYKAKQRARVGQKGESYASDDCRTTKYASQTFPIAHFFSPLLPLPLHWPHRAPAPFTRQNNKRVTDSVRLCVVPPGSRCVIIIRLDFIAMPFIGETILICNKINK